MNAESVFDLIARLNQGKKWMKEVAAMGEFRELFKEEFEKKDHVIKELNEQLQSKDVQLQNKDVQLQNKEAENSKLKEEITQLKKQLNRIAML